MCKRLIYLTSFVLVLVAVPLVTHAQVDNLLQNPSFEEDEVILDDPDYEQWATWNPEEGAGSSVTVDETEFIDGTRSLRVDPKGPENWHFIVLNLSFPADLNKQYTVSFWAKAETPRPLTLQMKAADNSISAWGATDFDLTTEWAEYHYTSEVLHADVKLEILCAGSEVPHWLDFVYVYEGEYVAGIEPIEGYPEVYEAYEAYNPKPRNGARNVPQEVALTWKPGAYVEGLSPKHRVFFSENFDDVNDGIGGIEQDVERYPIDGSLSLDLDKTYYWRVDEANSTTGWDVGALWRFTVIDHLTVDDFESYNDLDPTDPNSNRIFLTWIDGFEQPTNGAIVGYADPPFAEQTTVHSGKQAMPYYYDNAAAAIYSEAQRTFSPGQDWTREGVDSLSLWFRGNRAYVGSFVEAPAGTYTMTASGTDIWAEADEFHFAYKELSGAAAIIAKVESLENTDPFAKAGMMIRDTLDVDSRYAAVLVTPENGVRFQYRKTAGRSTDRYFAEGITAPQWVRLERTTGGLVRAFYSADGSTWTLLNMTVVSMNMPVYIGLAVTSHNADATCEAKFSNVSFPDTGVGPQWTDQDVGMLSNEAEPMYVTVKDSSGTSATVYHDDPNATLIDTWIQWNIDLQAFADEGVVLTDVSNLAIGFGGADNPQSGGSGLVFFDDIRLYRPAPAPEPAP